MISTKYPIIAITGPTASGKTATAIEIAKRNNGEIISADSRTIYSGMDIGTAKPTIAERQGIPHHLLDMIEPDKAYSAMEFKQTAEALVNDISRRGKVPIIVGGTGLYVYALLYNYSFPAGGRDEERIVLEARPLDELVSILEEKDPDLASEIDLRNKRRVVRAIETAGQPRQKAMQLNSNILLIGISPESGQLDKNISQRTKRMLQIGLVEEVRILLKKYGSKTEAFRSPGYAEIIDFLANRVTLDEAERLIRLHTRQLVKRQMTWFKRNQDIRWVTNGDEALGLAEEFLRDHKFRLSNHKDV